MFEFLRLAHPSLGPQPIRPPRLSLRVPLTDRIGLPLPLLAYDLPWSTVDSERAARVADALDELGIAVAALGCELGTRPSQPATAQASPAAAVALSNRFCPYRPERYGLRIEDLTAAKVIDIRLAASRDGSGRFNYSPAQMRRWDLRGARKADRNESLDVSTPTMHWPPDVRTLEELPGKVAELRQLAPAAAIGISLGLDSLELGLPIVRDAKAEILTIRADDDLQRDATTANGGSSTAHLSAARSLANCVARTRRWLDAHGGRQIRLIVVPPSEADAGDCVKLLALGAAVVAVDGWCKPLLAPRPPEANDDWAAATLGVSTRPAAPATPEVDTAELQSRIERMIALVESTGVASLSELGPEHVREWGRASSE
ncbi:hypothetical protein [Candidatus Laterigemmans baculatus]|uniref:hypothetical protein n=1 Tax=Candidatus Laterigemmans baculatus TaxID=2770505 RepID=UPI0013DBFBB6|nr:hypothetical protein [Candidatus Laterigemmans baculatus]